MNYTPFSFHPKGVAFMIEKNTICGRAGIRFPARVSGLRGELEGCVPIALIPLHKPAHIAEITTHSSANLCGGVMW